MERFRKLVFGKNPVLVGVISLGIALFSASLAQAAPQYTVTCDFCHRMPPLDSTSGERNALNGAVKGNHQGHADSSAASCARCHGSAVTNYRTGHRDKSIEVQGNLNNSPAVASYSRAFVNQSSVPPATLGSCSNVNCHFESTTPAWGSAGFASSSDCNRCHGMAPATGSHAKHASYYGGGAGACQKCHPDHSVEGKPFSHATSAAHRGISVRLASGLSSGGSYSGDGLDFLPSRKKVTFGGCSTLYCHSDGAGRAPNAAATWGGSLDCKGCHNSTAASGAPMTSGKHAAHVNNAATLGKNYGCAECHAATVSSDTTLAGVSRHVNGFVDYSGPRGGRSYNSTTGVCSTVYCHSDGKGKYKDLTASGWKSSATLGCKGCHGSDPTPAFTSSAAGEPNYGNGGAGAAKANTHLQHTKGNPASCDACHASTTADGTSIAPGSAAHANGTINVAFSAGKAGTSAAWSGSAKSCSNVKCHGDVGSPSIKWGESMPANCLGCHAVPQGGRAAITQQFGANSHHIQGTVSNDKCYQCHWEANSDGTVNPLYHHGSAAPGAPVELVVYGAGARPASYNATNSATAVQYTANGSRSEIAKISNHCLGCHSDQNNGSTPFGDGKTPKQYAWDGTSVAARYAQSGATTWGKYSTVQNAAQKRVAKAYSAHGNAAGNKRGWSSTTGVDGEIANTGGSVNVQCYDCHNSHGSTVAGTTTRYASATANGGILKDVLSGQGGYNVAYKPYSAGSATLKNKRNPGASLCLDCHTNANATQTPWGYASTYGATQPVVGYNDSFAGYTTSGAEQRFPYKKKNGVMGGHFGASAAMTTTPTGSIGGLCTPCHDPHGVSPTLGANKQYAVPLLKGTWLTSPYKEDVAPASNDPGTVHDGEAPYHIDQNTFPSGGGITESIAQSAGLCISCHTQSSLTNGNTHTWKSKDRVHEAVAGWKTAAGTKQHSYSCSKCHSAHTSNVLPRLMVTNCLNGQHKGRSGYNPNATVSGYGSGDWNGCYDIGTNRAWCVNASGPGSGSGSGRLPGNYQGTDGSYNPIVCHEGDTGSGTDQGWNTVTPWVDSTPTITSGPSASAGGPRVLLHMDEASWGGYVNEVKDSSGGNNNGTASSANTVAGGVSGRAGDFTAAYPSLRINYVIGGTPADNFTLEAWVKPTATHEIDVEANSGSAGASNQRYLFYPEYMASEASAGVSVGTNGISVYERGDYDGYFAPLAVYSGTISSTQWTHVAVVYTNRRPSIYVNGVLVRTGLQSLRSHVYASQQLAGYYNGYYKGYVDEVSIYDRALSSTDLQLHYQQQCPAISSNVSATISWSTITNGTSYVDYGLTTAYGSTVGSDALVMSHSVVLPNLSNHNTYHYRVRSVAPDGRSAQSGDQTFSMDACVVAEPPSAANGIGAAAGDGKATISWIPGTGAESSLIRYGTSSGVYSNTIDPAASPQSISGITNGTAIYYQVGAKNANGTTWSGEYTVTPLPPLPAPPTGVAATAGNTQALISWTPGAGSTSSVIHYSQWSGYYDHTIDPATSPNTITSLTNGTTYYFQVGAKNLAGITWGVESSVTPVTGPPSAPSSVTATPGDGRATFSWSAGTGATSYLIRYGTTSGVYPGTLDPATSGTTIYGFTNFVTVYYQVGSKNSAGITWSAENTVTPAVAPGAPTGINPVAGNAQATISFTPGSGATSSQIKYGTTSGTYSTTIGATSPQTITGLGNGITVYFRVGAVNANGTTWSAAEYSVLPTASAPLIATSLVQSAGNGQATLSWTAGANATSSIIRYGTSSGVYSGTVNPAVSPVTLSGANGTTIYYRIGSVNGSGTTWTSEGTVVPTASAPGAPSALLSTPGYGQASLTWNNGSNATSSLVRYGSASGVYGSTTGSVSSPLTITGLSNTTPTYYQVGGVNSYGTTWSSEASVQPSSAAPQAPTVVPTAGNGQATLSWSAVSGATFYSLRYGTGSGVYTTVRATATSPVTLTGLANGTTFYYQVGAGNASGTTWSGQGSVTPSPYAPSAPYSISASAGNGQATITWSPAGNSTIRYGTASGVYGTVLSSTTSPYTITSLANGAPIYYQVGAFNGYGTTWSSELTVTPTAYAPMAPSGIVSTPGNGQASLSWTPGTNSTSTTLRYGTVSGSYGSPVAPVTSPYALTATNGITTYYQLGGVNSYGTTWSAEYSVLPSASAPTAATVNSAVAGSGQATISWTAGTGATSSLVRYGTSSGAYGTTIDPAVSPCVLYGANGLTIYYQVGSKNAQGTTWSVQNMVKPVGVPTGISAAAGNGAATISWYAGSGSTTTSVRYGTASGVYGTTLNAAIAPLTISGLTPGVPLYYQVAGVNSYGTSWSGEYSVIPMSPPGAISAVAGDTTATVSWTAGTGSTSSAIRYGTSTGSYPTTLDPALSPSLIGGLTNGQTIYYQVGAKNSLGTVWSAEASVTPVGPPAAPSALATVSSDRQVALSWSLGINTTSSLLRYGTAPGVYGTTIDPALSPATIAVPNGQTVYYQVGARNALGTTWSAEATATAGAPAAPAPVTTDYYVAPGYYDYRYFNSDCTGPTPVTIAWNPVVSPDGDPVEYNVVMNDVAQGWQTGTTFTFSGDLYAGYGWYVKARDAVHPGAESALSSPLMYEFSPCSKNSCPLVYSFDGSGYAYQSDLQGPAISQIKKGVRNVALYQPSYLVLDNLAPDAKNQYRVKMWESLQEATLLDEAKLLAVDYPQGYQIVSSSAENTYYYGYANPFSIYTIKDPLLPVSATDKNGANVLAQVTAVDDNPAPMVPSDPDNYYTFDFGTVQHPEWAKLVIDGWQDIDSKLFTSTLTVQPYVEVVDQSGSWVKVKSFGMPAGDLKTMVVDLSGLFLSADQRVRLHLGIKKAQVWLLDRIRLDNSPPATVTVQEVSASTAELAQGGQAIQSVPNLQHRLITSNVDLPIIDQNFGYGHFTRYGDVGELLAQRDDKYVVMNYADKLEMTFPAPAPPEPGMTRGFMLKADVYYKEFKEYKYLEPMPFHAMSDYPPPATESYPVDAEHQQYMSQYNTRFVPGPANPTLTPQPSPAYAVGGSAEITFQWIGVTAPSGNSVQYLVEVSDSADMTTPQYRSTWQGGTSWTEPLPVGTWYWRVTARDSVNTTWLFSSTSTGTLTIVDGTPAAPVPVHQENGVAGQAIAFQWQEGAAPDGDALQYLVEVSRGADFAQIAYTSPEWLTGTVWMQTFPAGTWYWRVRARDGVHPAALSDYSATDSFTTVLP